MSIPKVIFGTATLGMPLSAFNDDASVLKLFEVLRAHGVDHLDSGARYPPTEPGLSETLIGESRNSAKLFNVDTKIFCGADWQGSLTPEAIERSTEASLERLKAGNVKTLYAHRPDPTTPLVDQIQAFNAQIDKGRCKEWGISRFPIETVREIVLICREKSYIPPAVYQGEYSIISRGMEAELLPLLRANGIRFTAFSPVAAGLLTGKLLDADPTKAHGTRFGQDHPLGSAVNEVYSGEELHGAVRSFLAGCKKHGYGGIEVALRWIFWHSSLKKDDGVILGASRLDQLEENLGMIAKGPLDADVVNLADELWQTVGVSRAGVL